MAKILVIRFSALGDVVMAVPVVQALAAQYPQHEICMLGKESMAAYFQGLPQNVTFHGVNLQHYKGLAGLYRLYREMREYDYIADFHDVIRTKVLRLFFTLAGKRVRHIEKGRTQKQLLIQQEDKRLVPLKSTFQRYADVLEKLGFPVELAPTPATSCKYSQVKRIGIAPFAAHPGKVYPLEKMKEVVRALAQWPDTQVYLYGGGEKEKALLEQWEKEIPGIRSMVGKLSRDEELRHIAQLQVMVSMDSANMHLASLVGTPVVSIWGATHPYAGFMGWGQDPENAVQVDDLPCRPCSIYGNKPCLHGDYPCLSRISPEQILERLEKVLK